MTDFLSKHFRYDTMSGWNRSTSYANNMKISNLGLSNEQEMKLLDIMDCEDAYFDINAMIQDFRYEHGYEWQAGFNGRSYGYLVLYRGGAKATGHKSFCTSCGQANFTSVEESGCRCGRCGRDARINYQKPPMQVYTMPGQNVDMDEDFEDWSMDELRERVKLVGEFDRLCDEIVEQAAWMADNYEVEEKEVMVPATCRVLKEVLG